MGSQPGALAHAVRLASLDQKLTAADVSGGKQALELIRSR